MPASAGEIIQDWEQRNGDRGTFLSSWQQTGDYMLPNRADFIRTRSAGQRRMERIFDAAPLLAVQEFAAGLHSLSTSPTLQWFWLRADGFTLNANQRVAQWLQLASRVMYDVFSSPKRNFATQSHELYLDQGLIGSATMFAMESDTTDVLFSCRTMKECCWRENDEDRVDDVIRQWKWTVKQAFEKWGVAAGPKVAKLHADGKLNERLMFLHAIRPRRKRNAASRDARQMAWESVYVAVDDKHVISESGFSEFPALCPRFEKVSGEIYGRSPGWTALPDVKMLNALRQTFLKAEQKKVDPPLDVPIDNYIMPIKTMPAGLNYSRGGRERILPIAAGGDMQIGVETIALLQQAIRATFYLDKMMMPVNMQRPGSEGKDVTATFWLQRRDANLQQLSPMLARMQSEFLGPLIDRVFAILWRKSVRLNFGPGSPFPPPPDEMRGVKLAVDYVSPVALAQRSSELDSVSRIIDQATKLITIDPKAGSILDTEAILRLTSDDLNAPASVLKSVERLQQERDAQAQAEQQMAQHMALANAAKTARDGSHAVKNMADARQLSANGGDLDNAAQPEQEAA